MMTPLVRGELDVVAVAPDARETLEVRRAILARRRDRSRSRPASTETASCRPAPLSAPTTGRPSSSKTSTFMPEAAALDLAAPDRADRIAARRSSSTMSVPPEIEARWTSRLTCVVDEVEALRRERRSGRRDGPHRLEPMRVSRGASPAFATASMNLADVPKSVMPASSAKSNRTLPSG